MLDKSLYNGSSTSATPLFSGDGLLPNLNRFVRLLRSHGISVPISSVLDALKGLSLIDIARVQHFYNLLRCNFIHKQEELDQFDKLFWQFWFYRVSAHRKGVSEPETGAEAETGAAAAEDLSPTDQGDVNATAQPPAATPPMTYSPLSTTTQSTQKLPLPEISKSFYESIVRLLDRLTRRTSRRYRYSVRGKDISLARILRKNMQFGGELLLLDFKRKKTKRRRVVFFCDVSGSMDIFTLMILQFVHVLGRILPDTEIFFFSTLLTRATSLFQARDFSSALERIPQMVSNWGGGTRIGYCLKSFNDLYTLNTHSSRTIAIIFSDGWDRGEIDLLRHQMTRLHHKVHKIIWLNPLLGTRDYQPICRGMKTALPFLDYLLPAGHLYDLQQFEKTLEKMLV